MKSYLPFIQVVLMLLQIPALQKVGRDIPDDIPNTFCDIEYSAAQAN
jgi:hypothetical protein